MRVQFLEQRKGREHTGVQAHKCQSLGRQAENSPVFADLQTLSGAFDSLGAEKERDRC